MPPVSALEVTRIDTTAGDTFSKMSAKDMGAPGAEATTGSVATLIRWPRPLASKAPGRKEAPAMAATAIPAPARAAATT